MKRSNDDVHSGAVASSRVNDRLDFQTGVAPPVSNYEGSIPMRLATAKTLAPGSMLAATALGLELI